MSAQTIPTERQPLPSRSHRTQTMRPSNRSWASQHSVISSWVCHALVDHQEPDPPSCAAEKVRPYRRLRTLYSCQVSRLWLGSGESRSRVASKDLVCLCLDPEVMIRLLRWWLWCACCCDRDVRRECGDETLTSLVDHELCRRVRVDIGQGCETVRTKVTGIGGPEERVVVMKTKVYEAACPPRTSYSIHHSIRTASKQQHPSLYTNQIYKFLQHKSLQLFSIIMKLTLALATTMAASTLATPILSWKSWGKDSKSWNKYGNKDKGQQTPNLHRLIINHDADMPFQTCPHHSHSPRLT